MAVMGVVVILDAVLILKRRDDGGSDGSTGDGVVITVVGTCENTCIYGPGLR